jgi:hypothetical protein
MIRTCPTRAAVAVLLGWGVWAGLARAEGPDLHPMPAEAVEEAPEQAEAGAATRRRPIRDWVGEPIRDFVRDRHSGQFPRTPSNANELPPGVPAIDSSPSKRPIRDRIRYRRPLGCWASFNGYGCSSLQSELGFVFGSCRKFYSEPCLKGAPPSALPPWAGPESGYHINPAGYNPAGYNPGGYGPAGYGTNGYAPNGYGPDGGMDGLPYAAPPRSRCGCW